MDRLLTYSQMREATIRNRINQVVQEKVPKLSDDPKKIESTKLTTFKLTREINNVLTLDFNTLKISNMGDSILAAQSSSYQMTERVVSEQQLIIERKEAPPLQIKRDPTLLFKLLLGSNSLDMIKMPKSKEVYTLTHLTTDSTEFKQVQQLFLTGNNNRLKIDIVEKVNNPYLLMHYNLKKKELTKKGIEFEEKMMFHGTKATHVDSILKTNFDWRLKGTAVGCKFGQGVSFSPFSTYSSHYGDNSSNKVMIAAKVLVTRCCEGTSKMVIPPSDIGTSVNNKRSVFVKYDDNTFYPSYLIHYNQLNTQKTITANFVTDHEIVNVDRYIDFGDLFNNYDLPIDYTEEGFDDYYDQINETHFYDDDDHDDDDDDDDNDNDDDDDDDADDDDDNDDDEDEDEDYDYDDYHSNCHDDEDNDYHNNYNDDEYDDYDDYHSNCDGDLVCNSNIDDDGNIEFFDNFDDLDSISNIDYTSDNDIYNYIYDVHNNYDHYDNECDEWVHNETDTDDVNDYSNYYDDDCVHDDPQDINDDYNDHDYEPEYHQNFIDDTDIDPNFDCIDNFNDECYDEHAFIESFNDPETYDEDHEYYEDYYDNDVIDCSCIDDAIYYDYE